MKKFDDKKALSGRTRLFTHLLPDTVEDAAAYYGGVPITAESLREDLSKQILLHLKNRDDCKTLVEYYKGIQPILFKEHPKRDNCENIVANFAYAIARNISSYTYSGGIQYVSGNIDYSEDITKLNTAMKGAHKETVSKEVQDYQSICGAGYMSIQPTDMTGSGSPFTISSCDPRSTFIVYSSYNPDVPVYAVSYYVQNPTDETRKIAQEYVYQVYTANKVYLFVTNYDKASYTGINRLRLNPVPGYPKPHILGDVPIVEFPNNMFRLGDFEAAISLLNAINNLATDCVYNVQSVVSSYLVLLGVAAEDVNADTAATTRILCLPGAEGINQDAKFIYTQLDGTSTDLLRNSLEAAVKFITGVPDRDSGQTGSDTGVAAELRTGQGDIETVAKTKALYASMAERKIMNMAIKIMQIAGKLSDKIDPAEIDVEITRINRDNLLSKTQGMMNMYEMGFAKDDIVYFGNITNDVAGVSQRWEENEEKKKEEEREAAQDMANQDMANQDMANQNAMQGVNAKSE